MVCKSISLSIQFTSMKTPVFFAEPSMDRWLEYAFTSHLQIVLIARPVDDTGRLHAHIDVGSSGGLCAARVCC